jgi:hypothetical protein
MLRPTTLNRASSTTLAQTGCGNAIVTNNPAFMDVDYSKSYFSQIVCQADFNENL